MQADLNLIVKSAFLMTIGIFVSKALGYFYQIFMARALTPSELGLFFIATSVLGIFTMLANFGIANSLPRFIAFYSAKSSDSKIKGAIFSSLKMHLVLACIFSAIMFFSADWIAIAFFSKPELAWLLKALAPAIPITLIAADVIMAMDGFKKIQYRVFLRKILEIIAKIIVLFFFVMAGLSLLGAIMSFIIAEIFVLLLGFFFLETRVFSLRKKIPSFPMSKEILLFSWPLLLTGVFESILIMIDTIMLGFFAPSYNAGLYGIAGTTAKLSLIPLELLVAVAVPIATTCIVLKKTGDFKKIYSIISRWVFLLALPITVLLVLFAEPVQGFLFGKEYSGSGAAMAILALGYFIFCLFGPTQQALLAAGKTKLNFFNATIAGIIATILNIVLIPFFLQSNQATVGAAISTMIAYAAWGLLGFLQANKIFKVQPFTRIHAKIFFASAISTGLGFFIATSMAGFSIISAFGAGIIFLFAYPLLLLAFKCFEKEDIEVMLAVEKKSGLRIEFLRNIVKKFI